MRKLWSNLCATLVALGAGLLAPSASARQFFQFESPHVHPLDMTPDGNLLLAVNTVDARIEIFKVLPSAPHLRHWRSVPVGIEPVSVRVRSNDEAWVVNHVSDSITVVDLTTPRVRATILTDDEPCDVVFAGSPQRAFVSISQRNRIAVYDPEDLSSPPGIVPIEGEDPRALATDGTNVFAAIFECGNDTTIIDAAAVGTAPNPYPGDPNPPPNAPGSPTGFSPPLNPSLPTPPPVSQIVQRNAAGQWVDERGADWTGLVSWDLHGHDVAKIDANSLSVAYFRGFMTTPMAIALRPDGDLVAVGTEALNLTRFEPVLNGRFLRVEGAILDASTGATARFDLNPHLTYLTNTVPMSERVLGIGDPRGVAVSGDGMTAYVTGMGSSNVVAVALPDGNRVMLGETGKGPTGIVLDEANERLFTLNRFDGSVSVLKLDGLAETATVRFFDPTPRPLKSGRPFLYDTHLSSGLGIASCASCHIDARMDQLAWDLGDPSGEMRPFDQSCDFGGSTDCGDWHPMKGPMVTQTLLGLLGDAPLHWRGDRASFGEFGHAAQTLLAHDTGFRDDEMAELEAYLASISRMPNPNRNLDGTLSTNVMGGNAQLGGTLFTLGGLVGGLNCIACHSNAKGGESVVLSALVADQFQSVKIAHLSNLYEKTGFDKGSPSGNRGFGFEHDGAVGTMEEFLSHISFSGLAGANSPLRAHVEAFLFSFDAGTHPAVGAQVTIDGTGGPSVARRDQLVAIASSGAVDLIVRTCDESGCRSYAYVTGSGVGPDAQFMTDFVGQTTLLSELDDLALKGALMTYTVVPAKAGPALLDRDGDGFPDGDERAACSDPADPRSTPVGTCRFDFIGEDGMIGGLELAAILSAWNAEDPDADVDCTGTVDGADLALILGAWGPCAP